MPTTLSAQWVPSEAPLSYRRVENFMDPTGWAGWGGEGDYMTVTTGATANRKSCESQEWERR